MIKLPEDIEAERALLATICAPGAEKRAWECTMALKGEDFHHPAHRMIFSALIKVLDQQKEVEPNLLADALRQSGELGRIGGFSGLLDILGAEEVRNPMVLVGILQGHRRRRELIKLGADLVRRGQDEMETPEEVIHEAGSILSRIAQQRQRGGIQHIADVSDDALADLTDEFNGHQGKATWVKGWSRLNGILGGFKPGQLIILAARPGIGKTALALNWILGITEYHGCAGFFSLEMSAGELWKRMISTHSGVDLRAMVANRDNGAYQRVGIAKAQLDQRGIWIEDRPSLTPHEIIAETARLVAKNPNLKFLAVDYLGLVSSPEGPRSSKQSEATRIGELSRGFKLLAGEYQVPVLVMAQMNREIENRQGGRPRLSDLRDSGCVEQDADVVMFIHRKMTGVQDRSAELIVAKQRNGPIGSIELRFDPETTRYSEVERETGFGSTQSYAQPREPEPLLEAV